MFTARVATSTTSTAAGLLTLGWLHGGGTLGRFGFFYFSYIFSLSIWALFDFTGTDSLEGSGLVSYGKEPKPQGRSAGKGRTSCALAPSFPILLLGLGGRRLTLMLHEMTCFPPTHRVCCSPVRLCHSQPVLCADVGLWSDKIDYRQTTDHTRPVNTQTCSCSGRPVPRPAPHAAATSPRRRYSSCALC